MNGRPRAGKCCVPTYSVEVPFANNHFCRTAPSPGRCPDSIDNSRNITVYVSSEWRRCKGLRLQMPVVEFFFFFLERRRVASAVLSPRAPGHNGRTFRRKVCTCIMALAEVHSQINKHQGRHSDTPDQLHFLLRLPFSFSFDVYIDLFVASH